MASFHKIAIWVFMCSSMLMELKAICLNTDYCEKTDYCDYLDCLEQYQCPNEMYSEVEIRVEEDEQTKVICKSKQPVDHILAKNMFSCEYDATVESCELSGTMADVLNITNIKTLKIDDCMIQEGFVYSMSATPLPKLTRLTLKATEFRNIFFQNINAPNLFMVDIQKMDNHVAAEIVSNLTQVEILNFMNNEINTVESNTLKNLSNLRELHMMFNSIEKINNEAFKDLHNLVILNLAHNKIRFINRQVLTPLKSLRDVYLGGNQELSLDNYLFANFCELSIVHLGSSDMTTIPEDIFSGSTRISEISLDNNKLTFIPRRLFEGLVNLKSLNLGVNKITSLDGVFESLVNLHTLELSYNEISTIGQSDFGGLHNLVNLNLNYNNISFIDESAFRSNVNLENLDLSNNKIQYKVVPGKVVTSTPFSKCEKLKSLDLSFNLIEDVPNDLFLDARLLKNLNLEGNIIESLDLEDIQRWDIAFRGINVNLKNNDISHFYFDQSIEERIDPDYDFLLEDLTKQGQQSILSISTIIKCDCFVESLYEFRKKPNSGIFLDLSQLVCDSPEGMQSVRFLDVPASKLTCDFSTLSEDYECTNSSECTCLWRPYDKTIIANCSSKNLTKLPVINIHTNLTYQKVEAHFEGNLLTDFSSVEGYENVTSLFLASNHMESISWIPPNIKIIDLSHNNFTYLTYAVLDMLSKSSVENITLGSNPWSCECDKYNMAYFLRRNIKKVDAQNIKCNISGLAMFNLNKEDICDGISLYIIILLLTFCPIIVLLVFVVFFYKYKQEIKIWLYARNLCIRFLVEEDLDEHKKYDVFVSYSQKDAQFVEDMLVPTLEGSPFNCKLCLHYRDWIPGSFITENITNSVTKSRRTLIVLTPNFLHSVWGKMEFRTAHAEAMKEKRNRVILLLKGEMDLKQLDDELRSYISTNTYIKWEDPWFWKKLRYALPRAEYIDHTPEKV